MDQKAKYPTYTDDQLRRYFRHIGIAGDIGPPVHIGDAPDEWFNFLRILQRYHLSAVPFENLSLHYSTSRSISLNPEDLYEKIVIRRRGGYCMETNCFFGTVLRSLGYQVTNLGARVSHAIAGIPGGGYNGWTHMVNLITLANGNQYMVDVGFGTDGQTQPLQLHSNQILPNISPGEMRLIHDNIKGKDNPKQKLWIYQVRQTPRDQWREVYCFSEVEFIPQDYEVINFWTSESPKSIFKNHIMLVRMLREGDEIIGKIILYDAEMKKRKGEEVEVLRVCKTESERIEGLDQYCDIQLTNTEQLGIHGTALELKN